MDATNEDDEAMMSMMGMSGFGSTKVCAPSIVPCPAYCVLNVSWYIQGKHVIGNQEGSADVKKIRTWRQYMNRYADFPFFPFHGIN